MDTISPTPSSATANGARHAALNCSTTVALPYRDGQGNSDAAHVTTCIALPVRHRYEFNDSSVHKMDFSAVRTPNAYVRASARSLGLLDPRPPRVYLQHMGALCDLRLQCAALAGMCCSICGGQQSTVRLGAAARRPSPAPYEQERGPTARRPRSSKLREIEQTPSAVHSYLSNKR